MKPKVSIVIPTYGRALYLKNLIESVRTTTPKDQYEIVIVSSDAPDSEKVTWLKDQPDMRLTLCDPRTGGRRKKSLYYYTNLGIHKASHEWIFVVNDDMIFDPLWYEELSNLLSLPENQNAGMVIVATHLGDVSLGCRVAVIGQTKKGTGEWKDLYLSDISLIRKDVLKEIGYFDEHLDWFGSGADNSLAVEFLTDKKIAVGERIKLTHYITEEHRTLNTGNAFKDFSYITKKWKKWCKDNNSDFKVDFGVTPPNLSVRLKNFVKRLLR